MIGAAEPRRRGHPSHDVQPPRAQPRRRVPVPHRAPHRGGRGGGGDQPPGGDAGGGGCGRPSGPCPWPPGSWHDHRRHHRTDRPGRAARRRRQQGPLDGLGHPDPHPAQPAGHHPDPRGAVLLHDPADHVRAAVPLRLRRGHRHPRRTALRRLPDARHLRADGGVRRREHEHRAGRGPAEGAHRAVPGPAHVPGGGPDRSHHGGRGPQRLRGHHHHRSSASPSASGRPRASSPTPRPSC